MENRPFQEIKEAELRHLAEERKRYPELFVLEPLVDQEQLLQSVGILNVFSERCFGYLRFWPQDFLVEEAPKQAELQTVEIGPFFKDSQSFSKEDLTIYATLVKAGLSTIEAQEILLGTLGLERKSIGFAGIKDKGAITSQLVSFRKSDIERIKKLNQPNLFLKNVYSGKGVVQVGGLEGNQFTILVRTGEDFKKESFLAKLAKIKEQGFWNFFYLQRFGSPRLINFRWGRDIVRGDYQKAVQGFLTDPGKRETAYFRGLRTVFGKAWPDYAKILNYTTPFPIIFRNEIKVLNHLKLYPKDFIGALSQIPDQVQLWVFAYASWLFNKKVSQFISEQKEVPEYLPLIGSKKREDWQTYQGFLEQDRIQDPLRKLRPFPFIQWAERRVKTREKAMIKNIKIVPEGVILCFLLPKACYATTFLSHFFVLGSGAPVPEDISQEKVNTKKILGTGDIEPTLERFKEAIYSKSEDILSRFD